MEDLSNYFKIYKFTKKGTISDLPKKITHKYFEFEKHYNYSEDDSIKNVSYYANKFNDVFANTLNIRYPEILLTEKDGNIFFESAKNIPSHIFLKVMDIIGDTKKVSEKTNNDLVDKIKDVNFTKLYYYFLKQKRVSKININDENWHTPDQNQWLYKKKINDESNLALKIINKKSHVCPVEKLSKCEGGLLMSNIYCPLTDYFDKMVGLPEKYGLDFGFARYGWAELVGADTIYSIKNFVPPHLMQYFLDRLDEAGIKYEVEYQDF